jgi:3D (Asp-Asp-Asp) domain-containing protein
MQEPWDPSHPVEDEDLTPPSLPKSERARPQPLASREIAGNRRPLPTNLDVIAGASTNTPEARTTASQKASPQPRVTLPSDGQVLGKFRNTYYDFPSEGDYTGEPVAIFDGQCKAKLSVPQGFFESLCVQGSGLLKSGNAVSFNRRDCECAPVCPRTGQKICFDVLDLTKFPWGRGATGQAITPLLTVAVDSSIVPLGTPVFIPEYVGMPRDSERRGKHDGCFVAQDRGLRVQGQHVDIFTGQTSMTQLWNSLVPSNTGVTVVVHSSRCERGSP